MNMADNLVPTPYIYKESELVKCRGSDCIILKITKDNLIGINKYELWNLDTGCTISVFKHELAPNELETIDFDSNMEFMQDLQVDPDTGNFDLAVENEENEPIAIQNRHSNLDENELDQISYANTEKATNYQTKWAVKILKGKQSHHLISV